MTRWERLEAYLFDHEKAGTDFSVEEYATAEGLDVPEASRDIQAYLDAQKRRRPSKEERLANPRKERAGYTLFVIRRAPGTRTRNARWGVGVKTSDARLLGAAVGDDLRRRIKREYEPSILAIAEKNPRAAAFVRRQVEQTITPALQIIELALEGRYSPPELDED